MSMCFYKYGFMVLASDCPFHLMIPQFFLNMKKSTTSNNFNRHTDILPSASNSSGFVHIFHPYPKLFMYYFTAVVQQIRGNDRLFKSNSVDLSSLSPILKFLQRLRLLVLSILLQQQQTRKCSYFCEVFMHYVCFFSRMHLFKKV